MILRTTLTLLFLIPLALHAQTTYTWTGASGSAWNSAANWSPSTGFPGSGDRAVIVSAPNAPALDMDRSVLDLTVSSGTLDLNGATLTFTGNGTFSGGAVNNGTLAPNSTVGTLAFSGTTLGASVAGASARIFLNGSVFNGPVDLTKTGTSNDQSTGGCTFNATTSFTTTGTGRLYPDNTGVDTFNGDLQVASTANSGIWFGQSTGSATLASGHTLTVGAAGFMSGSLLLRNFMQAGTTPQNILLGGTATLYYQTGTVFNASVTSSSPGLYLNGATFQADARITKTGTTNEYSSGGNIFNGTTEYTVTGSGILYAANSGADQYNGDLLFNCTGTGGVRTGNAGGTSVLATGRSMAIGATGFSSGTLLLGAFTQLGTGAQELDLTGTASLILQGNTVLNGAITCNAPNVRAGGATFQAKATFIKTGTVNDSWSGTNVFADTAVFINSGTGQLQPDNTGSDTFNGPLVVGSSGTGGVRFGTGGGAATLVAGRPILIASTGFSAGPLVFQNFSQPGALAQSLTLTGTATVQFNAGSIFNADLTVSAPGIVLSGTTFNGTTRLTKTGTSTDGGNGGNVFNGPLELTVTSTGALQLANAGIDTYTADVVINNLSTGQFRFGNGTGASTLASGRMISIGSGGFNAGSLSFRNFTQTSAEPLSFALGSAATISLQTGCILNGDVTLNAGGITLNGATFNGVLLATKTGTGTDNSTGGNTFNERVELTVSGTGSLNLDNTGNDVFNDDVLLNSTSTGQLAFGQGGGTAVLANGHVIAIGSQGFATGKLLFKGFTQTDSAPLSFTLGTAASLTYQAGTTFNGDLTSSSGALFLNGTTLNGAGHFTKTGTSGDNSTGGSTFNGPVEFILTNTGTLNLDNTGADAFNGDILLNSTSTGQIGFGQGGGTAVLAGGHTIAIGSQGFATGKLLFKGFTQTDSAPLSFALGAAASLTYQTGTIFNGDITSSSGALLFNGATFNDAGHFTKTGTSGDNSTGGNTFNSIAEFTSASTGTLNLDNTGSDAFNGDLLLNSTSTGQIGFGQGGGTAVLAGGHTIALGSQGFATGKLLFKNFTQTDNAPLSFALGTAASLTYQTGTTFKGDVTSSSGTLLLNGATFNGAGHFTKTGTSGDNSTGGNTFNSIAEFTSASTGTLNLDNTGSDAFNGDLLLNSTSTGQIGFGQTSGTATLASGHVVAVGPAGFAAGKLLFKGFTQAGPTPQNLVLGATASLSYQAGTIFNAALTSTSGALTFSGATFQGICQFTKTGTSSENSSGTNTFNGPVEFILTSTGTLNLDNTGADAFNANVLVDCTSSGQIGFGQGGGTATLADGRTIAVGSLGFGSGKLVFKGFTQVGLTPQNLALGATASLTYQAGTTFNGDHQASTGALLIGGTVFNSSARFLKQANGANNSAGGNSFNGTTEFSNTSTGALALDYTGIDAFNSDVLVNSTNTGGITFGASTGSATLAAGRTITVGTGGFSSGPLQIRHFTQIGNTPQTLALTGTATLTFDAGSTFNGDVTATTPNLGLTSATFNSAARFTKTGSASANTCTGGNVFNGITEFINTSTALLTLDNGAIDQFNGDLLVNSTSTGGLCFGGGTLGTATLAAGHVIVAGGTGYTAGRLQLKNFTQMGGTAQSLVLTGTGALTYDVGTTFNGTVVSASPDVYFNGTHFNNGGRFTKTAGGGNSSSGGNIFKGTTEFINLSASALNLDNTGVDLFDGDLVVNSTAAGGISFGNTSGTSTLSAGRTVTIGSQGFSAGTLYFRGFTQSSAVPQNLVLTGTATARFGAGSTFNGALAVVTPGLLLDGSVFNNISSFTKNGTAGNTSTGGNVFNADVEIITSSGALALGNGAVDDFNGKASFRRAGAGALTVANGKNATFSGDISTVGSTGAVQFAAGTARILFDHTATHQFTSDAAWPPNVRNLTLAMTGNATVDLVGSITVTNDLAFTTGVIRPQAATSTDNGLLILANGIAFSDAADAGSYVDGFVRKVGNATFTFPTGNAGFLAPITMSAPSNAAHHFTARYVHQDPGTSWDGTVHDAVLDHISHCEYWVLDRTGGTSPVSVTLSWDAARSCGVTSLADLAVAHWTGGLWKGEGGTASGTTGTGTIITPGTLNAFSPFTLGSITANNPLPIELLSFTAEAMGEEVLTQWATASEQDNDHFEVQRSGGDGAFATVGTLPGAGNSSSVLHYAWRDGSPLEGMSYYRLKQVDIDGVFSYGPVVPVFRDRGGDQALQVYPNPMDRAVNMLVPIGRKASFARIYDAAGRTELELSLNGATGPLTIDAQGLPTGIHVLAVVLDDGSEQRARLLKR